MLPLLFGPPRVLRVVAAYPRAVYLTDGSRWISLVAPGSLLPPDGIELAVGDDLTARCPSGALLGIGRGCIHLPDGTRTRPTPRTRIWIPTLPHRGQSPPRVQRVAHALLRALPPRPAVDDPLLERALSRLLTTHCLLIRCLRARRDGEAIAQAAALGGLGPGLTPLGDDILAGTLLALRLCEPDFPASLRLALAEAAAARTTARSASWLLWAGQGAFARDYLVLARTLLRNDQRRASAVLQRVLGIGSTSGWGVAYGLLSTASAATALDCNGTADPPAPS